MSLARNSPPQTAKKKCSSDSYEARSYQLELLDAAIEENTIVNLGTGAGKTFIAAMLIKELCSPILLPFRDEDAKRTVFLVTTVPLVKQQASYIETHTSFTVGSYIGDMGVDSWSLVRWRAEFDSHQVLTMTMTIFKNLVQSNMLPLKKVNLLILDECHHAVKNHDYVQIMKLFKPRIEAGEEVPRVLGLTASLIPSKCKPGEMGKKIKELEEILCARSQTSGDLMEVARHATDPVEEVKKYKPSNSERGVAELKDVLENAVEFLERFQKRDKEKSVYMLVKLYLDDLLHLLDNLGVWCANYFAKEGLIAIEEEMAESYGCFASSWEEPLLKFGKTRLSIFIKKSDIKLLEAQQMEKYPTTDKVKRLAHFLGDSAVVSGDYNPSSLPASKNSDKLLGIVFVERRTTAAMLTKLINHLKESHTDLGHINCDYVVGHNAGKKGTYLRREATMSVKKQEAVLNRFRKEQINLLISTSVVEEGVDVPRCNTVVRFDFPQNFRAYVQSKGRARAKVSKYLLLIDQLDYGRLGEDLRVYRLLEKELKIICRGRHTPDEEAILQRMLEEIEPYRPLGRDSPVATIASSLSLVHKYCQKLPKDRYTVLTPSFKTTHINPVDKMEDWLFQCAITLPMSCPLHELVEGQPMPTRRIAEKSAALEVVKKLHQANELDDHLRIVTKEMDSDLEDEEKVVAKGVAHVGTERHSDYYPNRISSSLIGCFPRASPENYLYIFLIGQADSLTPYQYRGPPTSTFGLLSSKPLPHVRVPKFSLYEGDQQLNVEVVEYHTTIDLSSYELEKLKLCHQVLFTELLKISHSSFHLTFAQSTKGYLVVPLCVLSDEDPIEAFLNMEAADIIIDLVKIPSANVPEKAWPLPRERFDNAIVMDIHRPSEVRKLYEVVRVDTSTTLQSPFPDTAVAATYLEYFQNKYHCQFTDLNQPALDCKPLGLRENRLKLLKSRYKSRGDPEPVKRQTRIEPKLFPELCSLYSVPTTIWKLARCLPSILWRVECCLLVNDFRMQVLQETGIGLHDNGIEVSTETYLHGYEDHGFGELLTQTFSQTMDGQMTRHPLSAPDTPTLMQRGPDNAILLQAFTPKGANDSFDLERLETLGDSFLKLATSVFLYHDRIGAHEGNLSSARSRRVGNLNLFLLAKKESKKITEYILSTSFEPRQMWVPPCFSFVQDISDPSMEGDIVASESDASARHYLNHKVTDKGVADCVESLIGAYLVAGGIQAALTFMKWIGIKIQPQCNDVELLDCQSGSSSLTSSSDSLTPPAAKKCEVYNEPLSLSVEKLPLFIRCSSAVFQKHFPPPPKPVLRKQQKCEIEKHLQKSYEGSAALKMFFDSHIKDKSLLLQALTHASYIKNRVTTSYQRLEFLGDAVLDYLVTCHIYSTFPEYSPGEITAVRTALVNNTTFAELAVKLDLHRSVLHFSPSLASQITDFLSMLEDLKTVERHEEVFIDQSSAPGPSSSAQSLGESENEDYEMLDPPKVLGDVLESVAGAIFLDSGCCLETVWSVFKPLFEERIRSFKGKVPVMPVQELLEREPTVTTEKSRIGRGMFRCTLNFKDNDGVSRSISGKGKTFKGARTAAAKAALREMNK